MTEYYNIEDIMISEDAMIGEIFRNTTINSALHKTPHMLDITHKIGQLCEHYFYRVSIDIATINMLNRDDEEVDIELKKAALLVYGVMCNYIVKLGILTEEEISEDVKDIQNIHDSNFYKGLHDILMEFAIKFDALNNQFYHA
jgi:hypothetical protein